MDVTTWTIHCYSWQLDKLQVDFLGYTEVCWTSMQNITVASDKRLMQTSTRMMNAMKEEPVWQLKKEEARLW